MPDWLQSRGGIFAFALAFSAVAASPITADETLELPLSGPAYELAEQASEAFNRRDYDPAIANAREALRQRPDLASLKRLLVMSLAASGRLAEAEESASGFIAGGDNDKELVAMRGRIRQQLASKAPTAPASAAPGPAFRAADAAYKAYARRRYGEAVAAAREAVRLAPDNPDYRRLLRNAEAARKAALVPPPNPAYRTADAAYKALGRADYPGAIGQARTAVRLAPANLAYRRLLVVALASGNRPEAAEQAATEALARWPADAELLTQRGYARLRLGQPELALDDFTGALETGRPTAEQARARRLALADAALTANRPERALEALSPDAGERSYPISSRRGYALLALDRREEALAAFVLAAGVAPTAADRARMVAAEIGALADLGRTDEARARFAQARDTGELAPLNTLDLAYLASRVGDDRTALGLFEKAQAAGELKGAGLLDAAYTAKRLVRNAQAVALFKAAIDAQGAGTLPLDPQRLFEVRREVADLTRTWGATASLSYGAVGVLPSSTLPTAVSPSGGDVLQSGVELYWRPPAIGYRNGRTLEVFGRVFETLADDRDDGSDAATGAQTRQGAFGLRWKPFSENNLVFELGRLVKIGDASRNDWLLRAAYSDGRGTDLRVDVPDWWMWNLYGEIVRYPETPETVVNFEARLGRSYRLDRIAGRLVITPLIALGGGYDNVLDTPRALGAGPGLNLRYWFREDKYTAPRSFLDFGVQYRFKLAGDDRAEGIFASLTLAY